MARVNVVQAQPPDAVRPAFDDVIRAREDEQRAQNQAQQYANQRIPEARGEAQRQIEQANAYKQQAIAQAEGEAHALINCSLSIRRRQKSLVNASTSNLCRMS